MSGSFKIHKRKTIDVYEFISDSAGHVKITFTNGEFASLYLRTDQPWTREDVANIAECYGLIQKIEEDFKRRKEKPLPLNHDEQLREAGFIKK